MSLNLKFSSLSLGASVDQQTGNLSVFEVIEEIQAQKVPFQMPSMVIALALQNSGETEFNGEVMIHHLTPDNQQRQVGKGGLKIPSAQRRLKAVFRFGGFPIALYGNHRIVVSWLDSEKKKQGEAILDFEVKQAPEGPAPQDQTPKITH